MTNELLVLFDYVEVVDDFMGIDIANVMAFFVEWIDWLVLLFEWGWLLGGYSNFTYWVRDVNGCTFVLRCFLMGELFLSVYDMGWEYKVIAVLWFILVLVFESLVYCIDVVVMGVLFYVMG